MSISMAGDFRAGVARVLAEVAPPETDTCARYASDPVGFARALGFDPTPWQIEILEAARDNLRLAIRSGHKVGKSEICAILALWFYCSFPGARVIITAATDRQVNGIIWRSIRRLVKRAPFTIPGAREMGELARTGLKDPDDFSEIVGFTARESEAMAGISGAYLLYIVDEASGVPDAIYEAIEGNRAAGARCVLISNPTRCEGEFYEAFHSKQHFYHCIHVSSRRAAALPKPIPGLATLAWIREKEEEWGKDSLLFRVRIEGEFPVSEERKICALQLIADAQVRWHDTQAVGRLWIGVDPAGPGNEGDETAFAIRRGKKIERIVARTGLTEDGVLVQLLGLLREHRRAGELPPLVVLDATGPVGNRVYGTLVTHAASYPKDFELARVHSSDRAIRNPKMYDRQRDELWAVFVDWLRDGGAIPEDAKLEKDLHAPEWKQDIRGRLKATDKPDLRKILGRSPDRGDAATLCTWEPASAREQERPRSQAIEHEELPDLSTGDLMRALDWTRQPLV